MLSIETIPVTLFEQNARILSDSDTRQAVVVDPGGDSATLLRFIAQKQLSVQAVWLTHSHVDHCGGVKEILDHHAVPLLGHETEREFRSRVIDICTMYGMPSVGLANCPEPSHYLSGGERLTLGAFSFEVLFVPGHSPGHLAFYCQSAQVLLGGDVLFRGSIGRTDLPGGDFETLLSSIRMLMKKLPPETRVLSGHGPDTTLGHEQRTNPFLRE